MNIVFFDDDCLICNGAVRLLIRLDQADQLHFAALKSETAQRKLANKALQSIDSVIYLREDEAFIYSEAVIEILLDLGFNVRFLKVVPTTIRDSLYKLVARNRHHFTRQACPLPTAAMRKKMLD
ncbi:thiol-disulfide oxidoreductase DCC family protein [Macrococcus bovicus]|uniref:DUF393 domain-containing protein n=1 Tax=Macrococcus bovicus TaxID=69968 RepID=A0A4R6C007_9STAP|nr:DCC1-like thiol-disulfide oxidoreductase family protein [Macrococcus bovicus]TDM14309.1 DUF393 domain-containing protein [Macrococcus bovicus]